MELLFYILGFNIAALAWLFVPYFKWKYKNQDSDMSIHLVMNGLALLTITGIILVLMIMYKFIIEGC